MAALFNPEKGTWVLCAFVAFFAVIVAVNAVFITKALNTHSGVVVKQPYKKGLDFNATLERARAQQGVEHDVSFENGTLRLTLPVQNAQVSVSFFRPVKDGFDFETVLKHTGHGVYEVKPDFPLSGAWNARLKATWESRTFQTTYDFIAR